jgi:hypothetical protein
VTYIDRPAPLIRRDPVSEYDLEPSPPPFDWREFLRLELRMFVRSALAMGAVVAVLLALFWIGGGR